MKKSKSWYKGNGGLVAGRSKLEAYQAGEYNSKCEIVSCKGCGRDTTNASYLCDECEQ